MLRKAADVCFITASGSDFEVQLLYPLVIDAVTDYLIDTPS